MSKGVIAVCVCKKNLFFTQLWFLFGLLGSKSAEVLREKLRTAIRDGNEDDLEKIIDECVGAAMPELDTEIQRARELFDSSEKEYRRG